MILSRLCEPLLYQPALWDLRVDAAARRHWTGAFRAHLTDLVALVEIHRPEVGPRAAAERVQRDFLDWLDRLDAAALDRRPHVLAWTTLREDLLRRHGLDDPYREVKAIENDRALAILPAALDHLRATAEPATRLRQAVAGVFAGNLFDLGSPVTARAHRDGMAGFPELRRAALARPWLRDDLGGVVRWLGGSSRPRRAVILVDNAGPDFVCGVLPLALILAERGIGVTLAANQTPTLNDVTFAEAQVLLERTAAIDAEIRSRLGERRLALVSTGTGTPGIDLRDVSPELDRVVAEADLLVIVGQGRAIETNWHTRLGVATLRLSALKDPFVAAALGGQLYDLVCDLRPADPPA